ncbi:MAG: hypothetical protein R3E10_17470 [Gemmatimonadota bacterium]
MIRLYAARRAVLVLLFVLPPLFARPASGQDVPTGDLRVFFDCSGSGCDETYLRQQITFVSWVRDRADADVHVLVTSEVTGGGGREYTLAFLGREAFAGVSDTLRQNTEAAATRDEQRGAIEEVVRAGLMRYLARAGALGRVEIRARGPGAGRRGGPGTPTAVEDPWNHWVFRIGVNSFLNGESSTRFTNVGANVSASRVTEDWKIDLGVSSDYSEQQYELSTGTSLSITREATASASIVRSIGAQWAAGAQATASKDDRLNQDLTLRLAPAVEYNVYPYAESTRRQLTVQYSAGVNSFDYTEETLFGRTSEIRFDHTLAAAVEQNQPWGSVNFNLIGSQFLHDAGKYSVTAFGGMNLRLTRGLTLRLNGSYSWIRDQLYLSGRELNDEEILLRLRQLQTDFRYFTSIGFQYQFGSIYNNVVNPRLRFRGRGGGAVFFF